MDQNEPEDFASMIARFESDFGEHFTKREKAQIAASDSPVQTAQAIVSQDAPVTRRLHHADYMSRAGGKFAPGRAGSAYYKARGDGGQK